MSLINPVIARVTLRALLGRRRSLVLLPLPVLLILLAIPVRSAEDVDRWTVNIIGGLGVGTILPLISLIVSTSVLGSEIEDGSAIQLLAKPVPRIDIILTKLVVAIGVTTAFVALPVFVAGVVATGTVSGLTLGFTVGALVCAVLYSAIFVMLSVLTRRAVAAGLLYVLLWENSLSNLLSGARVLSVRQYMLRIADQIATSPSLEPHVSLALALVMSVLISVLTVTVATDRLRSFSLKGESV
jgi:ABC-2 type transport system permease protein